MEAGRSNAPQAVLLAAAKDTEPTTQAAAIEVHNAKGILAELARYNSGPERSLLLTGSLQRSFCIPAVQQSRINKGKVGKN